MLPATETSRPYVVRPTGARQDFGTLPAPACTGLRRT